MFRGETHQKGRVRGDKTAEEAGVVERQNPEIAPRRTCARPLALVAGRVPSLCRPVKADVAQAARRVQ